MEQLVSRSSYTTGNSELQQNFEKDAGKKPKGLFAESTLNVCNRQGSEHGR